jgi:hypothetical protein
MMAAVDATLCGTAHQHRCKEFVMAARSIRSSVARFVVVTGLAASLFAGSFALAKPAPAAAAVNITCLFTAQIYYDLGDYYASIKNWTLAAHYYSLGDRTLNSC